MINTDKELGKSYKSFALLSLFLSMSSFYIIAKESNPELVFSITSFFNNQFDLTLPNILINIAGLTGVIAGYLFDKLKVIVSAIKNKCLQEKNYIGYIFTSIIGFILIGVSIAATVYAGIQISQNMTSQVQQRVDLETQINELVNSNALLTTSIATNQSEIKRLSEESKKVSENKKSTKKEKNNASWKVTLEKRSLTANQTEFDKNKTKLDTLRVQKNAIKDNSGNIFLKEIDTKMFEAKVSFIVLLFAVVACLIELVIYTLAQVISFKNKSDSKTTTETFLKNTIESVSSPVIPTLKNTFKNTQKLSHRTTKKTISKNTNRGTKRTLSEQQILHELIQDEEHLNLSIRAMMKRYKIGYDAAKDIKTKLNKPIISLVKNS